MKYFLIAGEASGDLHAAHLMQALREKDAEACFRFYGGDEMKAVGGDLLCHYKNLAYMGFVPVLMHLPTILRGLKRCCRAIAEWHPHCVILVDYPGFNLKVARYVTSHALCPVFYYISPKIWAWKERRIHAIRRDVSHLYSILPFEVDFYERKHHYSITYVGNPTLDEVAAYRSTHSVSASEERIIAVLPGSRRQEIADNLSRMLRAAAPLILQGTRVVVAAAPSIPKDFYVPIIRSAGFEDDSRISLIAGDTYGILSQATAALVTSGTATLETALFGVPQVVCYYVACGRFVSFLRRLFLKVPYVSLVNLICGREVVPELVADDMTVGNVRQRLSTILDDKEVRHKMLADYDELKQRLGTTGAPRHAAADIIQRIKSIS